MPLFPPPDPQDNQQPDHRDQRWPWWPLLPLYPYGQRRTRMEEIIPGRMWSFEQLHGVWYVAVPIRMTVLKVGEGLLIYSPIPATREVRTQLRRLEEHHGCIHTIVLATASGLEHKLPVPAMARAFPRATLWVTAKQWSFPVQLPPSWLGFQPGRTKVLFEDGLPHPDQLAWIALGPLELGLGTFLEVACLDRATGTLLVTDALVAIQATPPALFNEDPTPLLFHAREQGSDPLVDSPDNRIKGWKRILLFANFFRPPSVSVPALKTLLDQMVHPGCRNAKTHFGFYPFRWSADWESELNQLLERFDGNRPVGLAPVLERLVFAGAQDVFIHWLQELSSFDDINWMVGAHYHAPQELKNQQLRDLANRLKVDPWARSDGSWTTLASIDRKLLDLNIIPSR